MAIRAPVTRSSSPRSGSRSRTAADAEELRAVLRDWLPDAIVLDLQLPRTDGWELTREIKADPRTRRSRS